MTLLSPPTCFLPALSPFWTLEVLIMSHYRQFLLLGRFIIFID